ncbi:hypothetical protein QNA08_02490 [Chelatococcus sp. SYSU_G07232]|uniref:Uncharacterized protein n=1 Tax=Chelatococcus albus TaxID=3047466 RepID=A0ABT7ADG1_9HYPH|nr:hypothetical protein [Chelatococcus sp. SYSU_G07232]MDJ1157105.1 hypothetical protein [Chelatococcus sp. SYSU_G07232]
MGNWDNGQVASLTPGATLSCVGTIQNECNAIFLYNSAGVDHDTTVYVTGPNQQQPLPVVVPGTTGNNGLASLVLFDGTLTNSISVAMPSTAPKGSSVQAWIGSLGFPIGGGGLDNQQLQANGQKYNFSKYDRYYFVPQSHWYSMVIQSNINQFYSVMFMGASLTVFCVNPGPNAQANVYFFDDKIKQLYKFVAAPPTSPQTITQSIFGNGGQYVIINAGSGQDTQTATISLQSLQMPAQLKTAV